MTLAPSLALIDGTCDFGCFHTIVHCEEPEKPREARGGEMANRCI